MAYQPAMSIRDKTGALAEVTRYGQLVTAKRKDDILCRFEYNNSTKDVTTVVSGTGAASNATSQAHAESGTGVGACDFATVSIATYRPAHEMYAYGSVVFTTAEANSTQYWGPIDATDGYMFNYSGTTFGMTLRKNTVDTFVARADWDDPCLLGDTVTGFVLDPTKNNQYKIDYGWLGIAPVSFYVYGGKTHGWILVHTIDYTNTQTTPSILSPSFKIKWGSSRTSGTGANLKVSVGCVAGGSYGEEHAQSAHRVFSGS